MDSKYKALVNALVDYYDISFTEAEKSIVDLEVSPKSEPEIETLNIYGDVDLGEILANYRREVLREVRSFREGI